MPRSAAATKKKTAGRDGARSGGGATGSASARDARRRSAHTIPTVASSSVRLDTTNGMRGSQSRNTIVKYGANAPAIPSPTSDNAASNGCVGFDAYLPINTSGGARSAEDVADQRTASARNDVAPVPGSATYGRSRNAAHETSVTARTKKPSRPTTRATRSAA